MWGSHLLPFAVRFVWAHDYGRVLFVPKFDERVEIDALDPVADIGERGEGHGRRVKGVCFSTRFRTEGNL